MALNPVEHDLRPFGPAESPNHAGEHFQWCIDSLMHVEITYAALHDMEPGCRH